MRYRQNLGQDDVTEPITAWPTMYYAPATHSGDVVTEIKSPPATAKGEAATKGSGLLWILLGIGVIWFLTTRE